MTRKELITNILDNWDLNAVADDMAEREQLIDEPAEVFPEKNNEAIFYVLLEDSYGLRYSKTKYVKDFTLKQCYDWLKERVIDMGGERTIINLKIIRP